MIDLRQLKAFLAVARTRHLGRAADALHLSQPPLTRTIRGLEKEVGAELFNRTPRGMTLTVAGEALLQDAQAIVDLLEQAQLRTRKAGRGDLGRLDVGLYGSATFGVVPELLQKFQTKHPEVEITLRYAQMPQLVAELRQGRVLVAFERLRPDEPGIEVELVIQERLIVAVSSNHRFAGRRSLRLEELEGETFRMGVVPQGVGHIVRLCRSRGFEPLFKGFVGDAILAALLTSIGEDVALVPQSVRNLKLPGVTYVEIDRRDADATMDLFCFYRRNDSSPLLAAMLEVVRRIRDASQKRKTSGR